MTNKPHCLGYEVDVIHKDDYPFLLRQIDKPPPKIYICGKLPSENNKFLCVIGSRSHSKYGDEVCKQIIYGLRGAPVVIISGLAIGIDSLAHKYALEVGLTTIAVPGSGLADHVLYPKIHKDLAKQILDAGGALMSPFGYDINGADWTFPVRNALMAACSHAVLMIEARKDSGTMITADNALEFSRDLLAVPGSVFSELSQGTNSKIRQGAVAVTCAEDVLESLGLSRTDTTATQTLFDLRKLDDMEKRLLEHISYPKLRDELIHDMNIDVSDLNALISSLELQGAITEEDGFFVRLWKM